MAASGGDVRGTRGHHRRLASVPPPPPPRPPPPGGHVICSRDSRTRKAIFASPRSQLRPDSDELFIYATLV